MDRPLAGRASGPGCRTGYGGRVQGTSMDLDAITAIDVHVHVHASIKGTAVPGQVLQDMAEYFRASDVAAHTTRDIAGYYRERNMAAVVFGVDILGDKDRDAADSRGPTNEEIAEPAAEHADVLIPFASIDPARGAEGVRMARELLAGYPQIRGFKLHPSAQR